MWQISNGGLPTPYCITFSLCHPFPDSPSLFVVKTRNAQAFFLEEMRSIPHPLICKQIWAETTALFFESSSWTFYETSDLCALAESHDVCMGRIQKMRIDAICAGDLVQFCQIWKDALTPAVLQHFTNLTSITIRLDITANYKEL
jgi:hypothetical protein